MGHETCHARTILVVDDDEAILAAFNRSLERTYDVLLAKSGASALELARQRQPDIAIVDLQLKHESGIDLIPMLKALNSEMRIVLISGYASVDVAVDAMRAGADDVLTKPCTSSELMNRLGDRGARQAKIETPTLARAQWEHVQRVLGDCDGNISMAARRLGMYRSTLQRWLRRHAPRAHA